MDEQGMPKGNVQYNAMRTPSTGLKLPIPSPVESFCIFFFSPIPQHIHSSALAC